MTKTDQLTLSNFRIFAQEVASGVTTEITDWLYFFEEEGLNSPDADGLYRGNCTYRIWLEPKSQDLSN